MNPLSEKEKLNTGVYIDLFSGCGGLSLGLGHAGWRGLFAVEKDPMAFSTFKHNMVDGKYAHFDWPKWLPQEAITIESLLKKYSSEIATLKGKVDLIAGGPPCQGFSLYGMRNSKDPRNKLSQKYIKMVDIIKPKYILLENVRGFTVRFKDVKGKLKRQPHSELVKSAMENMGYQVFTAFVASEEFGVPQKRTRFIMVGIREGISIGDIHPFSLLDEIRKPFLKKKKLPPHPITVEDAISDLEAAQNKNSVVYHSGRGERCFKQLSYGQSHELTPYQSLMRKNLNGASPNSMRFARHEDKTIEKFKLIRKHCMPGYSLNKQKKELLGIRKQVTSVLDPQKPSKVLTTAPDDILHYKELRILTVRESARIQSFPDDFDFKGKYTTGGKVRVKECPRYTQVGNAVPPLLGEALGTMLKKMAT